MTTVVADVIPEFLSTIIIVLRTLNENMAAIIGVVILAVLFAVLLPLLVAIVGLPFLLLSGKMKGKLPGIGQ
jgi:hypothetical protein